MSGAMGARSADAHPPRPPQSPSQPQPPQAQPHHPPRAYPAPPNSNPGPPPVPGQPGGQGYPQGGHSGQTYTGQTPSGQTRVPGGAHTGQHQTGQHHTGQQQTGQHQTGQRGASQSGTRRARTGARTLPRVRKARLRVARVDPWSVMKVGFLLSIALGICTVVAVSVLWMVMDAMGVFSAVGGTVSDATSTDDGGGFDLVAFLSLSRVLTFTGVIAAIDVVLATALATLGAFVYNLSAGFVGGIEVTLAEDE